MFLHTQGKTTSPTTFILYHPEDHVSRTKGPSKPPSALVDTSDVP